ncbi:hypothetical protein SDC9_137891 [bioreactor metagenome]|uniref:Uncharacterized protein n=1 Tax=bioreactor metagenome TaxID=1076179 RepID=A0A645DNB5_9ZZZZ|nr:HTH domain-containing protein [Proteiniphilum sp.]MEA4918115.1 HTH domain-containing protein [Proteiniphilum sp.]
MKIREEILEMIRESTEVRRELARQLDVSDSSISRYIKENEENGEFTKAIAIKVISLKLNLPESLILES